MSRILSASRNIKKTELSTVAICCSWAMYRHSEFLLPDNVRGRLNLQFREFEEKWKSIIGNKIENNEIVKAQDEKDEEAVSSADGMQLLHDLKYLFSTSLISLGMNDKFGTTQLARLPNNKGESCTVRRDGGPSSSSGSKPPGSGFFLFIPSVFTRSKKKKDPCPSDECDQECVDNRDVTYMTPRSAPVDLQIAPFAPANDNEGNEDNLTYNNEPQNTIKVVETPPETCNKCSGILPPSQYTYDAESPQIPLQIPPCDCSWKTLELSPMDRFNTHDTHTHESERLLSSAETEESYDEEKTDSSASLPNFDLKCVLDNLAVNRQTSEECTDQSDYSSGDSDYHETTTMETISEISSDSPQLIPKICQDRPQMPSLLPPDFPYRDFILAALENLSSFECLDQSELIKSPSDSPEPKVSNSTEEKMCAVCQTKPASDFGYEQPQLPSIWQTQQTEEDEKKQDSFKDYKTEVPSKESSEYAVLSPKLTALESPADKESKCKLCSDFSESTSKLTTLGLSMSKEPCECNLLPSKVSTLITPEQKLTEPCECTLLPPKLNALTMPDQMCKCPPSGPCECILLPPKLNALTMPDQTCKCPPTEPCECTLLPPKLNALTMSDQTCKCPPIEPCECTLLPPKLNALTMPDQNYKCPSTEPCECMLLPPKLNALTVNDETSICSLPKETSEDILKPLKPNAVEIGTSNAVNESCEESKEIDIRANNDQRSLSLQFSIGTLPEEHEEIDKWGIIFPPQLTALGGYPQSKGMVCGCEENNTEKSTDIQKDNKSTCDLQEKTFPASSPHKIWCSCGNSISAHMPVLKETENKSDYKGEEGTSDVEMSPCENDEKKGANVSFLNMLIRDDFQKSAFKCKTEAQPHAKFGYPPSFTPLDVQPPSACPPPPPECPPPKCPLCSGATTDSAKPKEQESPTPKCPLCSGATTDSAKPKEQESPPLKEQPSTQHVGSQPPKEQPPPPQLVPYPPVAYPPQEVVNPPPQEQYAPQQVEYSQSKQQGKREVPIECQCPQCKIVCGCPPDCCCVSQRQCCNISCCCCCSFKKMTIKQLFERKYNEIFAGCTEDESCRKE